MRKRTLAEALSLLPEPLATRAIRQANPERFTSRVDSIFDAVASFAEWSKTPEGLEFWIEVSEAIDHDEINEEKINQLLNL
jgi:antibiotic biosynthesis monooxygenase (ABM) superfamily enzyme